MSELATPIDEAYRAMLQGIARDLDQMLNNGAKPENRTVAFTLLLFDFDKPLGGRVNYISNAKRDEMLTAMKEFIARSEGRIADEPVTQQ